MLLPCLTFVLLRVFPGFPQSLAILEIDEARTIVERATWWLPSSDHQSQESDLQKGSIRFQELGLVYLESRTINLFASAPLAWGTENACDAYHPLCPRGCRGRGHEEYCGQIIGFCPTSNGLENMMSDGIVVRARFGSHRHFRQQFKSPGPIDNTL